MDRITPLENMLAAGRDNSLLRYGLGQAYLDDHQFTPAITHLRACVAHDATYSAAWKLLGKAYMGAGDTAAAADAWRHGITAAQGKGDKQAEKEMTVFLRRAERSPGPHPG